MFDAFDRPPILDTLRAHVTLDTPVSDALTALHAAESDRLARLLKETRDLAGRLGPANDAGSARLDLEPWLRTVLCGPHDKSWFDIRIRSGRQDWAGVPHLASAVLMARLRAALSELAISQPGVAGAVGDRIVNGLGRLFDLEMAIIVLDMDLGPLRSIDGDEMNPSVAAPEEATLIIRNSLAVIETSAYLIGRYSERTLPPSADIDRHLDRIWKQVHRAKTHVGRLVRAVRATGGILH